MNTPSPTRAEIEAHVSALKTPRNPYYYKMKQLYNNYNAIYKLIKFSVSLLSLVIMVEASEDNQLANRINILLCVSLAIFDFMRLYVERVEQFALIADAHALLDDSHRKGIKQVFRKDADNDFKETHKPIPHIYALIIAYAMLGLLKIFYSSLLRLVPETLQNKLPKIFIFLGFVAYHMRNYFNKTSFNLHDELMLAICQDNRSSFELLLQRGKQLKVIPEILNTPQPYFGLPFDQAFALTDMHHYEIAIRLLQEGARPEALDCNGFALYHIPCRRYNLPLMRLLLWFESDNPELQYEHLVGNQLVNWEKEQPGVTLQIKQTATDFRRVRSLLQTINDASDSAAAANNYREIIDIVQRYCQIEMNSEKPISAIINFYGDLIKKYQGLYNHANNGANAIVLQSQALVPNSASIQP